MTELFLKIVNMSITASILVLLVLLLRLILKKAPKWVNVLLWGLVAVRLICPFGIESEFSLMPKTEWIEENSVSEDDLYLNSVPDSIPAIDFSSFGKDITLNYYTADLETEVHGGVSVSFVLSCVWLGGIALLILHTVISAVRLGKSVGEAVRVRGNIWESSAVDSPFVLGLFRPRIYVPRGMTEANLAYVIAHEEAHIRRRDHWWKPLGFLLLTIHWFNPMMWLAYIMLCRDIEMACDERVVKEYDTNERADYAEALLECSVSRSRKMISACPLAFGEVGVKTRIKSVLNYKKPAFWVIVIAVVLCAVAAVCFVTDPIIVRNPWVQEYVVGAEGIRGQVNKDKYESVSEDFAIGADEYGRAVFKEPLEAFETMTKLYSDGLELIRESQDIAPITKTDYELYKKYGWQMTSGSEEAIEQAAFISGFLDIYENSFTKDVPSDDLPEPTVETKARLTLDDVTRLSEKGEDLTWEDFAEFKSIETGSGIYIRVYEIDETFYLMIGDGDFSHISDNDTMTGTPWYIRLCVNDSDSYADVTKDDVAAFITEHQLLLCGTPVYWFIDTAWEKAQQTAEEKGLNLLKDTKNIFHSENGEYVGVEFYEEDMTGHVRIAFFRDENGKYTTELPEQETSADSDNPFLGIPAPVVEYQSDIIEKAAESIFGAVTVYSAGVDKLEQIPTATVGISEEVLLYRLDYWITKGINGLEGTPPEDIYRETVYFAMLNDWTSDTWTRLGELSEAELDALYNTPPMLELYGNKYTAAASGMHQMYLQKQPVEFTAVIKEFDTDDFENGMMSLNIVEFITRDDTERIAELGLSEQDMISGYYIHDEDESITTLKLPADTEFIFYDWGDEYTDETDERYEIISTRWISTRDAELFYEYWEPYKNAGAPGYPFVLTASEESVVIKEIPLM